MSSLRTLRTESARQYRFRLQLQTKTSDDWGNGVQWVNEPDGEFYADVKPQRAVIKVEGDQEVWDTRHFIHVPWRPGLNLQGAIGTDHVQRFRASETEYYYIESFEDMATDHREFEVVAIKRVEEIRLTVPLIQGGKWERIDGGKTVRI